jgi:hypothetical protein
MRTMWISHILFLACGKIKNSYEVLVIKIANLSEM